MWQILQIVCGLGAWACSIMVGVKALQRKQTVIAILCFLPCLVIVGLIYGWIKATEWGIKNLMLVFTALFVLAMIFAIINAATTAGTAVSTR